MAKKTRKQKQRAAAASRRVPGAAPPSPTPLSAAASLTMASAPAAAVDDQLDVNAAAGAATGRRRIERLSPAVPAPRTPVRQQRGSSTAAMFRPLETEDAAIPFDRVPYVPADLRRVGVMAACMIVLVIIAAVIVSHVVT